MRNLKRRGFASWTGANLQRLAPAKLPLQWLCCALFVLSGTARTSFAQLVPAPLPATLTETQLASRLQGAGEEERINLLLELSFRLGDQISKAQPATVIALTDLLNNDAAPLVRSYAAHALGLAGTSSAADSLLAALVKERSVATQKAILYALVPYPAPQTTATLLPLLKHKERELRATVAFVLAEQADTAATPALLEFIKKRNKAEDAFARSQALRALGRIGYTPAIPLLIKALKDDLPVVRREAATALGWLSTSPNSQVQMALTSAANDEDPYLRAAVRQALTRFTPSTP